MARSRTYQKPSSADGSRCTATGIRGPPFVLTSKSAATGAVGGGGLGDLGIRYGYQRFLPEVMVAVVVVLIVLVQGVQTVGDRLARRLNKRLVRSQQPNA